MMGAREGGGFSRILVSTSAELAICYLGHFLAFEIPQPIGQERRISYLGDPFRSNERSSFDITKPSHRQPVYKFYLRFQGDCRLFIL